MTALTHANTATRAGDREREVTAGHLGQALAEGYLDMAEYEDRVLSAFSAHTAGRCTSSAAATPAGAPPGTPPPECRCACTWPATC
jgi:hypothetical protein